MMIETLATVVDDSPMIIHVAFPKGSTGPGPAVLVCHHKDAVDEFTHDRLERLAEAGYIAVAPEYYHRLPDATIDEQRSSMLDPNILADSQAAILAVNASAPTRVSAWAVLGHCMGGRMSMLNAAALPVFKACVAYYPGRMDIARGSDLSPFDRLSGLKCPTLGFFGNDDKNPSPSHADKLDAALTQYGVPHEFHRYDGTGHAFQNFTDKEAYRAESSRDAWAKTLAFLKAELKP